MLMEDLAFADVPRADLQTLEWAFGKALPGSISGPGEVGVWAQTFLPWASQAGLLSVTLPTALAEADLVRDSRAKLALQLLTPKPRSEVAARAWEESKAVVETLCRLKGYDLSEGSAHERAKDPTMRAWSAVKATAYAARWTADHPTVAEGTERAARAVLTALVATMPVPSTNRCPYCAQVLAATRLSIITLAAYASTWSMGWRHS